MKRIMTRTMGRIRKTALTVGPALMIASAAYADAGTEASTGGMSPLMLAFLIFLAVIIGIQLIPAMVIFGSLITAVFKRSKKATRAETLNGKV
jgi:hypothetical protein